MKIPMLLNYKLKIIYWDCSVNFFSDSLLSFNIGTTKIFFRITRNACKILEQMVDRRFDHTFARFLEAVCLTTCAFAGLRDSKKLLKSKAKNVTEVAFELGYAQQSNFTRAFKKHFGTNPTDYLCWSLVFPYHSFISAPVQFNWKVLHCEISMLPCMAVGVYFK